MKKSNFVIILYLVLISFSPVSLFGSAIKITRMLTQPAISKDHIAFIYADHLWMANVDGSDPRRLTTNKGIESNPVFSPDGKLLAFSGQYNGNTDVYLLSIDGGVPKRLTWHPADDIVRGFTPDGKSVLFASQRTIFTSTIATWGGFVGVLGVPELLDGGVVMAPNLGVYTKEGWQIENKGIAPDIEVEQLPFRVIKGEDPQLQKAIEVALKELDQEPPAEVLRPAYPVKVHH